MCKFFSLVSDGKGKPFYFDAQIRKLIIEKKLNYESADSHTSIADYYGYKGEAEDTLNKYEYNVFSKFLTVDHMGTTDDSKLIKEFLQKLDFKTVVPELIIKPIINPLIDIKTTKVAKSDIILLQEWASVRASVSASVRASVSASVRGSVSASVRGSVSVSVRDSVWDSVRDSVRDSVWDSVGASVWDSVWDYVATFFAITHKYDFSPSQKLWERGLVPSFDGTNWRLHGYKGKILYTTTKEKLMNKQGAK